MNQLVNGATISDYDLAEDGRLIIFQTEAFWWQYDVMKQNMTAYDPLLVTEHVPTPVEEMFYQIQAEDPRSHSDLGSLSPDKTKMIYWVDSDYLTNATSDFTSTSDPDPNASENYGNFLYEQVFLLEESNPEPVFFGEVQGDIQKVHWLPSGHEALLEMSGYSSYFMWLIDSGDYSLTPLLSREQADNSQKFDVLDISNDGKRILYQIISSEGNVYVYNLDDLSIKMLSNFPHTFGAWWIFGSNQILAAGPLDSTGDAFYICDLYTKQIEETIIAKEKYTIPVLIYQTGNQMIFITDPEKGQYTLYSICID